MNLQSITHPQQLAQVLALSGVGTWRFDHGDGVLQVSPSVLAQIRGDPLDAIAPRAEVREDLVHEADWPGLISRLVAAQALADASVRFRVLGPHGVWRWLEAKGRVQSFDGDGRPAVSAGVVADVSDHVWAEMHHRLQLDFAETLLRNPDRDTLVSAMLDTALALEDIDAGGIYARNADGGYTLGSHRNLSKAFLASARHVAPGSQRAMIVDAGEMLVAAAEPDSSGRVDPLLQDEALRSEGFCAAVILPIRVAGRVQVCLNLASRHARRLPTITIDFLRSLASQFGVALERLAMRETADLHRRNLEHFLESLPDFVLVLDLSGTIVYANPAAQKLRCGREELLGRNLLSIIAPDAQPAGGAVLRQLLRGEHTTARLPLLRCDGRTIAGHGQARAGTWDGEPALLTIWRDLGELQDLQDQLLVRNRFQRALLDNFPFMVWLKDTEGRVLETNRAAALVFGYRNADLLRGKTDMDLWPPELARHFQEQDLAVLADRQSRQYEEQLAVGDRRRWFEIFKSPVSLEGKLIGTVGFARDIDRRRRAEAAFEKEHRLLRTLVDSSPDLVWLKDRDGAFLACNRRFEALVGRTEASLLGCTDFDLHPTDVAESLRRDDLDVIEAGTSLRSESWVTFPADGHRELLEKIKTPVFDATGELIGVLGVGRDITQRVEADRARSELLTRFQRMTDHLPGFTYQFRLGAEGATSFPFASSGMAQTCGIDLSDLPDASAFISAIHPDDLAEFFSSLTDSARQLCTWDHWYRITTVDGRVKWIHGQAMPQRMPDGGTLWHGYAHDATSEREASERLRLSASVFEYSYNGIMITDAQNIITEVNPAFCRITGYDPQEAIGRSPRMLSSGRQDAAFYAAMWRALETNGHWSGEIWNRRKSGEVYAEALSISVVRDAAGSVSHYVAFFSDITHLKTHEAELAHIAHYDALTGLPNRRLLSDRMKMALSQARRNRSVVGLCMLDLDGFKEINDVHGHEVGDQLLVEISQRIVATLREDDTVARLGGDEFVLVLSNPQGTAVFDDSLAGLLDRVLSRIAEPMVIGEAVVHVTASIGVALYPEDDTDPDTLLRHADQAMYRAKQEGKARYILFDVEQDLSARQRLEQLAQLARAIRTGELVLWYQPRVDLVSGRVIGVEALVRWQHPELGLRMPEMFLPLLSGLPLEITFGEWVISEAIGQLRVWAEQGLAIDLSINISPAHLLSGRLCGFLVGEIARNPQVQSHRIELEIVESAAIDDFARASSVLKQCRDLGFRISLDDFGTGFSSLTHLRELPVDLLKIDRSFVQAMLEDPNDLGIVDSVIRLAQAFDCPVVAEGMETPEQGAALLLLGCDQAQGYFFSRPLPADHIGTWLAARADGEDLPVLQARHHSVDRLVVETVIHHQTQWTRKVTDRIEAWLAHPTCAIDLAPSRLQQWCQRSGAARFRRRDGFARLVSELADVQRVAEDCLHLAQTGQEEQVRAHLPDLHKASDRVIEAARTLVRAQ